jgi:hypothetical protein
MMAKKIQSNICGVFATCGTVKLLSSAGPKTN